MQTSAIISKHFNIKVFQTFLVTLSTLFGILMISRLTGYFEKASRGELELSNIFFVVLLRLPDFSLSHTILDFCKFNNCYFKKISK